ncbi:MAG: hypothetical protein JWO82_4230 [Akkermansiaceae bacterium]|nr:hypothetical protein [Akkermansiaceae bacterium]
MKSLLDIPMVERWAALEKMLPEMISAHSVSATLDPSDEICVADLADRHGLGERAMVNRLRALGGKPYQFGTKWFIRKATLVLAMQGAEETEGGPK